MHLKCTAIRIRRILFSILGEIEVLVSGANPVYTLTACVIAVHRRGFLRPQRIMGIAWRRLSAPSAAVVGIYAQDYATISAWKVSCPNIS